MKKSLTLLFIMFASLMSVQAVAQQHLVVQAPDVVAVGEPFRVVFTANGVISDFEWGITDDFVLMWGPQKGTKSIISIVNGKRESSKTETYTYLLQASKKGKFTLPGASCNVDKTQCSTSSITIEVVEGETDAAGQQNQQGGSQQGGGQQAGQAAGQQGGSDPAITGTVPSEDIFLRLNLSQKQAVKGEPIDAVLKIYTRADISGFEDFKLPTFNGFWSKATYEPQNLEFRRENVGGKIYNAAVIRRYTLIPQQEGSVTIDPSEVVCQIRVRAQGRTGSIFDDFFDSYQTVRKRISTGPVVVRVNPLPSGAPASFGGGVGEFDITAKFSTDSISANEAASLIVTVSGKGNVSMLSAPKIEFPSDFELYDTKTTDRSSDSGTSGSKTFEFPFIARSYGDFTVGPVNYSYYDISKKQYVTISAPAVTLKVSSDGMTDPASAGGLTGAVRQAVKNIGSDIRFIATDGAGLRTKGRFLVTSPLFYILLAVLAALYFILASVIGKVREMKADVVGTRNRKANKMATARLRRSKEYLDKGLVGAYYEELHKAVLGYVADKLSMPQSDLSKENISGNMAAKGVSEKVIEDLMNIINTCEMARYAPDYTPEQMEEQYKAATQTIMAIESGVKKGAKKVQGAATAIVLLLGLGFSAWAQEDVKDIWESAAQDYTAGEYQSALEKYLSIEASGKTSDKLCYNIGNAYFKAGDLGHSVLYYEKALKLNPGYADAQFNLDIARESVQDKIEVVPEFILKKWVKDFAHGLSSDGWAVLALVSAMLALALLLCFKFAGRTGIRRLSFILAMAAALMFVVSVLFAFDLRGDVTSEDSGIVMLPVSSVKSSPADNGKSVFILHEGTKVEILDRLGDWVKVEIADGRQGWMPASDMEVI